MNPLAPVARWEVMRMLLAFSLYKKFEYQIDVKGAFLNAYITEEVYAEQLPWSENAEFINHVIKLENIWMV